VTARDWTRRLALRGGTGPGATALPGRRYLVRARPAPVTVDCPIEDEEGELAFSVDERAVREGDALVLGDPFGRELHRVPGERLYLGESVEIEGAGGGLAALVRATRVRTVRGRWTATGPGWESLELRGSVPDDVYVMAAGETRAAEISKRWFRLKNTNGVAMPPGEDGGLLIMIAVAADPMAC